MTPHPLLLQLVRERAGFQMSTARQRELGLAIQRAMQRENIDDVDTYAAMVSAGQIDLDDLVDDVMVGETYFFREPDQFAYLRSVVIPEIVARKRGEPVRVWSAGCSSGEEPYSLAILFEEMGIPATIVATDISREAIAEAKTARYGKWSLRGPDAARARRWLRGEPPYHLDKMIREKVTFERLNLATDTYPSIRSRIFENDLVLCRNVLIYLEPAVIARVAAGLHASLSEDGWLFTASSDPPLFSLSPLVAQTGKDVVCYRRTTSVPALVASPAITPMPRQKPPVRKVVTPMAAPTPLDVSPTAESEFTKALALVDARNDADAIAMLKRALYLDPSLIVGHLSLGLALGRAGDTLGALRELRTVRRLCEKRPPDELVPHSGGTCIAQIAGVAESEEHRHGKQALHG